jgi:hypothetical protein
VIYRSSYGGEFSLRIIQVQVGADGVGPYATETGARLGVAKFDKPAVKIMLQVTQIGRFLLERGLKAFS